MGPVSVSARRLVWLAWILWTVCVVVGELLPHDSVPMKLIDLLPVSDKVVHFVAYAGIALCPALALGARDGALFGAAAVAMGVALEYIQRMVGRDFEVGDMLANAAGVLTGLLLGLILRARTTGRIHGDSIETP